MLERNTFEHFFLQKNCRPAAKLKEAVSFSTNFQENLTPEAKTSNRKIQLKQSGGCPDNYREEPKLGNFTPIRFIQQQLHSFCANTNVFGLIQIWIFFQDASGFFS